MAARTGTGSCIALACLALELAGCAGTTPPDPILAPPCDLICQVLRLFDLDQPPAPPVLPAPVPVPTAPPRRPRHEHHARRPSLRRHRHEAPPPSADDAPVGVTVVPQTVPAASPPAPPVAEASPRQTMSGSPPITPPWFEPWTQP